MRLFDGPSIAKHHLKQNLIFKSSFDQVFDEKKKDAMKKNIFPLFVVFALLAVGCKSGKHFGCSKDNSQPIDLRLGEPGKTEVKNNLPQNDNVKTLESDENIEFTSDDGEAIITHNSNREINVGDIIVANPEQRYLVRVKEILTRASGRTQAILRQGRIDDLIGDQTGSVHIESTPVYDLEDIKKLERYAKAQKAAGEGFYEVDNRGRVHIRNLELFSVHIADGQISGGANKIMGFPIAKPNEKFTVTNAVGGKYRAVINEAIIEIVPTLRSESQWESGKISHLQTRIDTKVRYRVDISYEAAGEIQLEAVIDAFMPKKVIPFRVPGPTPVYLDIELGVPAGVSLQASKNGKTRVIYESEYDFFTTMNYNKETGVTTDKDQRVAIKDTRIESSESDTKLQAEIFLKPQVTARLYRVVGPYAYLKPYVRGEIEWPSVEKKDDLFVGVTGGVGIELSEPIFVSELVSYESGKLFDLFYSFDLDKAGGRQAEKVAIGQRLQQKVNVDEVGPEGFVRFQLKEHLDDGFLRYELIEPTHTGLLVPSETFYMDGDLFYYPMPHSQNESFKVRVYGKNGHYEDVAIEIGVSSSVTQQVSQDRYGLTTNSYKVSNGNPNEFKSQVPNYNLGGFTARVQKGDVTMGDCIVHRFGDPLRDREMSRRSRELCKKYAHLEEDYYNYLGQSEGGNELETANGGFGRPESGNSRETQPILIKRNSFFSLQELSDRMTKIKLVKSEENYFRYEFLNLIHFGDYVIYREPKTIACVPALEIKTVNTKTHMGLRFITKGCGDLSPVNDINVNDLRKFMNNSNSKLYENRNEALKWQVKAEEQEDDIRVVEVSLEKSAFLKIEFSELSSTLFVSFPLNPSIKNLFISHEPKLSFGYDSENPYSNNHFDIFNLDMLGVDYSLQSIIFQFNIQQKYYDERDIVLQNLKSKIMVF